MPNLQTDWKYMDNPSNRTQGATLQLGTHWGSSGDHAANVHITLRVPKWFLPVLIGNKYSGRFIASVRTCTNLLRQPLFGGKGGDNLRLSTNVATNAPLEYRLTREGELPAGTIAGLGEVFKDFVKTFAAGPQHPMEVWKGNYLCNARIEYWRAYHGTEASLRLQLHMAPGTTKEQFKVFKGRALLEFSILPRAGRQYLHFGGNRRSNLGQGSFTVTGELFGSLPKGKMHRELDALFRYAAIDLGLED